MRGNRLPVGGRQGGARSPVTGHWLLLFLAACARVQAPPGGPLDRAPPVVVSTFPDSLKVLPGFHDDVEFRFGEVISEGGAGNFGLGTGDLEKLVILSPTRAVPIVRWKRNHITVRPREGWRPNTVYRIELLGGVADLSGNRSRGAAVVTFTTGAPLPTGTLRGRVVSWATQRPVPQGLVEALLLPDSVPYRTLADSLGRFVLGPIPKGDYLVYGVIDQNKDFRFEPREDYAIERTGASRDSVGEIWTFHHDTTAARITTAEARDSVSVLLTFSQWLNPYQRLPRDSVRVLLLPDSVAVPVVRSLPQAEYDTAFAVRRPVDTTAAGRARADSVRADSIAKARADSTRADSIARARAAAAIRIPGVQPQRPSQRDTTGTGPLRTRPALFDKLVVRLGEPLRPGGRYAVVVRGLENLSRVTGEARGVVAVPQRKPPADTTKVKPDSTKKPKPDAPGRRG